MELHKFHVRDITTRSEPEGYSVSCGYIRVGCIKVSLAGAPGGKHDNLRGYGLDLTCLCVKDISAEAARLQVPAAGLFRSDKINCDMILENFYILLAFTRGN